MLDSTKIFAVPDGVALSSDVRSGRTSTTWNSYLKSLIELLVCSFDYVVVRENGEADIRKSMHVLGFGVNRAYMISQELTSSAGL